jgi:hypothetical protein
MHLPPERHYNPFRALAETADGELLWEYIRREETVRLMIGAIRVGHPAVDAIADEVVAHPSFTQRFQGNYRAVEQWKQFTGKLVALALAPYGYRPKYAKATYNHAVFKNGALYEKS